MTPIIMIITVKLYHLVFHGQSFRSIVPGNRWAIHFQIIMAFNWAEVYPLAHWSSRITGQGLWLVAKVAIFYQSELMTALMLPCYMSQQIHDVKLTRNILQKILFYFVCGLWPLYNWCTIHWYGCKWNEYYVMRSSNYDYYSVESGIFS